MSFVDEIARRKDEFYHDANNGVSFGEGGRNNDFEQGLDFGDDFSIDCEIDEGG